MSTAILLEVCFAARDPAEWDARTTMFSVFPPATPTTSTHEIAMSIQGKLWHGGKVRAAVTVSHRASRRGHWEQQPSST